jgi:exodeoxyribonuclease V beta subunit
VNPLDLFSVPLEGTHLIEASAGTGKTYTIASLFLRLLLEKRMTVRQILVVTYTVPATDELKIRIRDRIRTARQAFEAGVSDDPFISGLMEATARTDAGVRALDAALRQFDEASIFTIHGFCHRMISDMAFESSNPFDSELTSDASELVVQAVSDFFRVHFTEGAPRELLRHATRARGIIDTFLSLARRASLDAEVIPDLPRPVGSGELAAYRQSFVNLKSAWPSLRQGFMDLLVNSDALRRNMYRADRVPVIIARMDEYLATDGSGLPSFDDFAKFTPEYLGRSVKNGFPTPCHEVFDLAGELGRNAEALKAWMDRCLVWLKAGLISFLRRSLPERKEALGIMTFDDLLLRMHRAVRSPGMEFLKGLITERYRAVLIDEFQDTDPIQAEIFTRLFSGTPLYFIGDPKQAIYTFRGADIFAYLNAARGIDEGARHTLARNYRSEPGLISAVNSLFDREGSFVVDDIVFRPVEPAGIPEDRVLCEGGRAPLTIWYVSGDDDARLTVQDAEQRITRAVAAEVSRLLGEGRGGRALIGGTPVMPRDIAVIVRKHKQGRLVRDSLTACGIPSVVSSEDSVFGSGEAGALELVLRAVAEPLSGTLIRAASPRPSSAAMLP